MSRLAVAVVVMAAVFGAAYGATVPEQVERLFDRALTQLRAGESEAALLTAREAVTLAPRSAEAWMSVGYVRRERGEFEAAASAFAKAGRLAPGRAMPWVELAWTCDRLGDYQRMEQAALQAVQLAPELPVAWRARATAQWNLGRLAEAEGSFRRALRLEPENGRYRVLLSQLLSACGEQEGAEREFEAGMADLRNQMAEAYLSQSWSLQDAGQMAGAAQAAVEGVRVAALDETRAEGCYALAYAQLYSGNLEAARKSVTAAIKLAPQRAYYHDTAVIVALLSDDLEAAEQHRGEALAGEAAGAYVSPALALLWARQGKREQALGQLEKVAARLKAGGGIPDDYYLAGRAWGELGEPARALEMFVAGAARFPRHPWGIEMARRVEARR